MDATQIPRRARDWPQVSQSVFEIPDPPNAPSPPNPLLFVTSGITIAGVLLLALVMFAISGPQALGSLWTLLLFGVLTSITTGFTAILQNKIYHDQLRAIQNVYDVALSDLRREANDLNYQAQDELNRRCPPIGARPYHRKVERPESLLAKKPREDIGFWSKRPLDADFLMVRLGIGAIPAPFETRATLKKTIAVAGKLDDRNERRKELIERCQHIPGPVTIELHRYSCVAILTDDPGDSIKHHQQLNLAHDLLLNFVGQAAYHCSPNYLQIWTMAPASREAVERWEWADELPHAWIGQSLQSADGAAGVRLPAHTEDDITKMLGLIAREIDERRVSRSRKESGTGRPHLLIIVDYFKEEEAVSGNQPPTQRRNPKDLNTAPAVNKFYQASAEDTSSTYAKQIPIRQPELAAALTGGAELGMTTVCICSDRNSVPEGCELLIDLRTKTRTDSPVEKFRATTLPDGIPPQEYKKLEKDERKLPSFAPFSEWKAIVTELRPDPSPNLYCDEVDECPPQDVKQLVDNITGLQEMRIDQYELPPAVDFDQLFSDSPNLETLRTLTRSRGNYDPRGQWDEMRDKEHDPSDPLAPIARIPIGFRLGGQKQYLHINNDVDGSHGMIAGQTGAGKSVLLQTIITAFAITHPPEYLNFLLVDFKSGLALDRFRSLPHTVGFLSDVASTAQIERFVTMVRAEKEWRSRWLLEQARAQGTASADGATSGILRVKFTAHDLNLLPRLLIVVDEFAEMAAADANAELIKDFVSVLRQGRQLGMHLLVTGQRPEGKMASQVMDLVQYRLCLRSNENDSKQIIGVRDAADLPVSIQGRCYMQHPDKRLDLFQAANTMKKI